MTTHTLRRGDRLPGTALPSADGARVPLRGQRGPLVILIAHSPACTGCLDYVREMASAAERITEWGTTIRVVATSSDTKELRKAAGDRLRVLVDEDGVLAAASAPPGAATLLVADEWGEIYFVTHADDAHDLPSPDEVADWTRFVAVQCPECEQPEGEWRNI